MGIMISVNLALNEIQLSKRWYIFNNGLRHLSGYGTSQGDCDLDTFITISGFNSGPYEDKRQSEETF